MSAELSLLIAYCGLDCQTCPIHVATLEIDESKRQKMRISIAKFCSEQYGMNLSPEEVTDCDGCRSNTGRLFSGCLSCKIRTCAMNRNLESCAYCDDYVCNKLQDHFKTDHSAQIRLQAIRDQM
jgi:hypothetical protein